MKRIIMLISSILIGLAIFCGEPQDSLDAVREFKPDDKYFKAGLVNLHFIIETSAISKIDTVFQQFHAGAALPVRADGCRDGVFVGDSPYDAYDYRHVAKITIKNERIVSVDYNEILKDGRGKQEDEAYCEKMSVTGTTPAIAYPFMEKQLVEKQNILQIDGVTGASYSLYRFRYAVMVALIKARLASK